MSAEVGRSRGGSGLAVETPGDGRRASGDEPHAAGTSGEASGTSGGPGPARAGVDRATWLAYGIAILAVLAICAVNVLTTLRDREKVGVPLAFWQPAVWEATSAIAIIALLPLVRAVLRRHPPTAGRVLPVIAVHAGATLAFAVLHVTGMVILRKLAYAIAGETYRFGWSAADLLYEFRKDVFVYLAVAGGFWVIGRLAELERALAERREAAAPVASPEGMLTVRDGAKSLELRIADMVWAASAGNYVEIALADGRRPLVRGTLQGLEATLAPHGFVRVHRTRIVNGGRIATIESKGTGDLVVALDDGTRVTGSRRYKERLKPYGLGI